MLFLNVSFGVWCLMFVLFCCIINVLHVGNFCSCLGSVLFVIESKRMDCFNSTTTTIILSIVIVSGNRFFREWKEKMDCGRCVIGIQTIIITSSSFQLHFAVLFCSFFFKIQTCPTTPRQRNLAMATCLLEWSSNAILEMVKSHCICFVGGKEFLNFSIHHIMIPTTAIVFTCVVCAICATLLWNHHRKVWKVNGRSFHIQIIRR